MSRFIEDQTGVTGPPFSVTEECKRDRDVLCVTGGPVDRCPQSQRIYES